jgi:hypothetical protein
MESVPQTRNCWAPEAFYDHEARLYRVIWTTSLSREDEDDWNHRIWSVSTPDFREFSAPEIFFDPGFSVIDASVLRVEGEYWMAFKDERGRNQSGTLHKRIHLLRQKSAVGWSELWQRQGLSDESVDAHAISPELCEGPAMAQTGESVLMVYDHFIEKRYSAHVTQEGGAGRTLEGSFPHGMHHGCLLFIDEALAMSLRKGFG